MKFTQIRADAGLPMFAAAAKSGAAMPDGSYPIENTKDLENAIQAIGRAPRRRQSPHQETRQSATASLPT
jgi:hypothetical protein